MSKSKIKICGIKKIEILDTCIKYKVDYFGIVFYKKSPRNIDIKKAKQLISYSKNKKIIPIGVFVDEPIKLIKNIIDRTNLKYLQLHGSEDSRYISTLKEKYNLKIIKAFGIENKKDFENIEQFSNADYYLFDYKPEKSDSPGGNAKKFNWNLLKNIKINKPWFISGGININNIHKIHKKIFPYGIDISSGVEEKKGLKSSIKIKKLMEKINGNS